MGDFVHSLHLFKVELKPKYLNSLTGSEPFLPSIVLRHDMAHLNNVYTIYSHVWRVLSPGDSCLLLIKPSAELPCMHTEKSFLLLIYKPIVLTVSVLQQNS